MTKLPFYCIQSPPFHLYGSYSQTIMSEKNVLKQEGGKDFASPFAGTSGFATEELRKRTQKSFSHRSVCSDKTLQLTDENMLCAWFINISRSPPFLHTYILLQCLDQAESSLAVMLHSSECRLKAGSKEDTGISLKFSLENQETRHKGFLGTYEQAADVCHHRLPERE